MEFLYSIIRKLRRPSISAPFVIEANADVGVLHCLRCGSEMVQGYKCVSCVKCGLIYREEA